MEANSSDSFSMHDIMENASADLPGADRAVLSIIIPNLVLPLLKTRSPQSRKQTEADCLEGVSNMPFEADTLDRIDALYDMGRDFLESEQVHGAAAEFEFDVCKFDKWRRKVNDLLFSLGGCEDLYYQRFSKEVTKSHIKHLEEGLRILSAVRDDVSSDMRHIAAGAGGDAASHRRPSVSYH